MIASYGFCCEQFFLSCKAFAANASRLCKVCGVGLKKGLLLKLPYRFSKAFAVIASYGLCCEELSFIL